MRQWRSLGYKLAGSLTALGLVSWLVGCSTAEALRVPPHPAPPHAQVPGVSPMPASPMPTVDPRLVTANTRFGFKLFSEVAKARPGENLMISPASVAIALSMTYTGARGETQQAMARALELSGMTLADLNQANADLERVLENADPHVQVAIANSLWGRQDFRFRPEFLQQSQQFYNARVETLDFSTPAAVRTINNWVSEHTQGKIPTMLDQISAQDVLFLINAIYFKGDWQRQFNPRDTVQRPFTQWDGSTKPHPLMSQRGHFSYQETEQFQAIRLPYGNGRLTMVVILPKSNFTTFLSRLTPENWQTWRQQFRSREGSIQLPKFKQEFGLSLNDALKAMGMAIAFEPGQADFSGISDRQTFISNVQHKTLIEVNEAGTEAAAATSVGITATSIQLDPPFAMVCDRPFFYAIEDSETGSLLFMGTVVAPQV